MVCAGRLSLHGGAVPACCDAGTILCLSVCLYDSLSVCLSVCLTVCLSVCLSVSLSVCLYEPVCVSVKARDWWNDELCWRSTPFSLISLALSIVLVIHSISLGMARVSALSFSLSLSGPLSVSL